MMDDGDFYCGSVLQGFFGLFWGQGEGGWLDRFIGVNIE